MYTCVATISESEPLTESQGRSNLIRFPVCPWHQLEVRLQVPEDLSRANQKFKVRDVSESTCHVHVADHIHCVHLVHTPYQWLRSNASVIQVASVACMQQGSCSVKYVSKYITFLSKWQHRFCVYPSCDVPGSPELRALHSYHQYPDRYPDIWIRIPWCSCLPRVPGPIRFSLRVMRSHPGELTMVVTLIATVLSVTAATSVYFLFSTADHSVRHVFFHQSFHAFSQRGTKTSNVEANFSSSPEHWCRFGTGLSYSETSIYRFDHLDAVHLWDAEALNGRVRLL